VALTLETNKDAPVKQTDYIADRGKTLRAVLVSGVLPLPSDAVASDSESES
jgi:hypothetical protein